MLTSLILVLKKPPLKLFVALAVAAFICFLLYNPQAIRILPVKSLHPPKSEIAPPTEKRNFTILDWCPAFFSRKNGLPVNAFFNNCLVTRDRSLLNSSDVVVIDVRRLGRHLKLMPQTRSSWQRWVYFNIESPFHAILGAVNYKMSDFKDKYAFNWTMTYRTDGDVPMLHGWTVKKSETERKKTNLDGIVRNKTKLAAALMSNCAYVKNGRGQYVKELQKYMEVDVYGSCGKKSLKCRGHYTKKACDKVKYYKFFLAFENSNCRDYISFKMWMQGFGNNAVPVVMGAYKEDYIEHVRVPPNSIIYVDDFESPKELAEYLKMLDKNDTAYRALHKWREIYKIDYDYRFLGSFAWTTLCSKLNSKYNEAPKWHNTLTDFEHPSKDCYLNKWVKKQCKNDPYRCR